MTTLEKYKQEIDALPQTDPRMNLLKRMLGTIDGQAEAYRKLQESQSNVVEKLKDTKDKLKLQTYKALCLETLMVKLYTYAEASYKDEAYKETAMREMLPYLAAAGYDFEKRRMGVDE